MSLRERVAAGVVLMLSVSMASLAIAQSGSTAHTAAPQKTPPVTFLDAREALRQQIPVPRGCLDASQGNVCFFGAVPTVGDASEVRWLPKWMPLAWGRLCLDSETADYQVACTEPDAVPSAASAPLPKVCNYAGEWPPACKTERMPPIGARWRWPTASKAIASLGPAPSSCSGDEGEAPCVAAVAPVKAGDDGSLLGWTAKWVSRADAICIDSGTGSYRVACEEPDAIAGAPTLGCQLDPRTPQDSRHLQCTEVRGPPWRPGSKH